MSDDAVVCMRCGFDQKAGVVRKAEVAVEEVEPPKPVPDFVVQARATPKVLAIIGGSIGVIAMIATGIKTHSQGWGVLIPSVLLTLYVTVVHACTGVIAVAIAAKLSEQKLGRIDLAAARMLVAVSIFEFVRSLEVLGVPSWLSNSVLVIVAAGAYLLFLMILFKKDHTKAGMIAVAHLAVYALFEIGAWLSVWLSAALAAAPHPAG